MILITCCSCGHSVSFAAAMDARELRRTLPSWRLELGWAQCPPCGAGKRLEAALRRSVEAVDLVGDEPAFV